MRSFLVLVSLCPADGLDNGLAITPPMGWRSWNQFGLNVNSSMFIQQARGLVDRSRKVNGEYRSLADLGYTRAGIDDGWQECGSGFGGKGFHNESGYPQINTSKFADVQATTKEILNLGISPGWYGGNCYCSDHRCSGEECYQGDVDATLDFGFTSIKLDSCGAEHNVSLLSELFNASGVPVLIENCHNGHSSRDPTGELDCPMNLFRSSGDIRPTFGSILGNLWSVRRYNENNLTGPGCWAYPDMLEVGVTMPQPPGAKHHCETDQVSCEMNFTEWRTHFGAWCVTSSPLILGMDLSDSATLDLAWPILTNWEAIEVNQLWYHDSGRLHSQSKSMAVLPNCGSGKPCNKPGWMVWTKTLPPTNGKGSRIAALLMNNGNSTTNVSFTLDTVHGLGPCGGSGCAVRDIWAHAEAGHVTESVTAVLEPHDSAFFIISSRNSPSQDCLQYGIQYDSHDVGNTNLEETYRAGVADGAACQALCHTTEGCKCFTTNVANGHCWLMSSCDTPKSGISWAVSGPATCPTAREEFV